MREVKVEEERVMAAELVEAQWAEAQWIEAERIEAKRIEAEIAEIEAEVAEMEASSGLKPEMKEGRQIDMLADDDVGLDNDVGLDDDVGLDQGSGMQVDEPKQSVEPAMTWVCHVCRGERFFRDGYHACRGHWLQGVQVPITETALQGVALRGESHVLFDQPPTGVQDPIAEATPPIQTTESPVSPGRKRKRPQDDKARVVERVGETYSTQTLFEVCGPGTSPFGTLKSPSVGPKSMSSPGKEKKGEVSVPKTWR